MEDNYVCWKLSWFIHAQLYHCSYRMNCRKAITKTVCLGFVHSKCSYIHTDTFRLHATVILRKKNASRNEIEKEKDTVGYVAIPYVKGLFEKIAPIFKDTNKRIVGRSGNNLQRWIFTRLKDKVPKMNIGAQRIVQPRTRIEA